MDEELAELPLLEPPEPALEAPEPVLEPPPEELEVVEPLDPSFEPPEAGLLSDPLVPLADLLPADLADE